MKKILLITLVLVSKFLFAQDDAISLLQQSVNLTQDQKFSQAVSFAEKAVDVVRNEEGRKSELYGIAITNLAHIYMQNHQYSKAKPFVFESLSLYVDVLGKTNDYYPQCLGNVVNYYRNVGDYTQLQFYMTELCKYYDPDAPEYVWVLSNQAQLFNEIGNYGKAEELFLESIKLYDATDNFRKEYAIMLSNMGLMYYNLGQYTKAETYYLKSKTMFEKNHFDTTDGYLSLLNNLSCLYIQIGDNTKSVQYNQKSLTLLNRAKIYSPKERLANFYTLANIYYSQKQYNKALELYERCESLCDSSFGRNHPYYAAIINGSANVYESINEFSSAKLWYKKSLSVLEKSIGTNNLQYAQVVCNLAGLFEKNNQPDKAYQQFEICSEKINKSIKLCFESFSEKEKGIYIKTIENFMETIKSFVVKNGKKYPKFAELLYNNILIHKGLLLYNKMELQKRIEQTKDTSILYTYRHWIGCKQQLSAFYNTPEKFKEFDVNTLENNVINAEKKLYALTAKQTDILNHTRHQFDVNFKSIPAKLQDKDIAIECFSAKHNDMIHYFALILRKNDQYPVIVDLGLETDYQKILNRNNIDDDLIFTNKLYDRKFQTSLADSLYLTLWQPLTPFLANSKRIFISPTGLLHRISFQALRMQPDKCLGQMYEIRNLISTQDIVNEKNGIFNNNPSILLYGGIVYDCDTNNTKNDLSTTQSTISDFNFLSQKSSNGFQLEYLSGSLAEINSISDLAQKSGGLVHTFSGKVCTEKQFRETDFSKYAIVHISTHGLYQPTVKDNTSFGSITDKNILPVTPEPLMHCGLMFANANCALDDISSLPDNNNGIVTAYDITQHSFASTQLVVLSACQTGLGDVVGNEGVVGFTRAFKTAGVEYQMVSLWKVNDYYTAQMLNKFYEFLFRGIEIHMALRLAQVFLQLNPATNNPYFWAGFVLIE